jgi:hypothetical protein
MQWQRHKKKASIKGLACWTGDNETLLYKLNILTIIIIIVNKNRRRLRRFSCHFFACPPPGGFESWQSQINTLPNSFGSCFKALDLVCLKDMGATSTMRNLRKSAVAPPRNAHRNPLTPPVHLRWSVEPTSCANPFQIWQFFEPLQFQHPTCADR